MSDYEEARMEAMNEFADEHYNEGITDMQNEVLNLLDEMIADELRFTVPQIGALKEARCKIADL